MPARPSAARSSDTTPCTRVAPDMGGRSPHSASITSEVGTTRPAFSSSNASRARGLGPPTATGPPPTHTSIGPRTRYSTRPSYGADRQDRRFGPEAAADPQPARSAGRYRAGMTWRSRARNLAAALLAAAVVAGCGDSGGGGAPAAGGQPTTAATTSTTAPAVTATTTRGPRGTTIACRCGSAGSGGRSCCTPRPGGGGQGGCRW